MAVTFFSIDDANIDGLTIENNVNTETVHKIYAIGSSVPSSV